MIKLRVWTEDKVRELKSHIRSGKSGPETARIMRLTYDSVKHAAKRRGLRFRPVFSVVEPSRAPQKLRPPSFPEPVDDGLQPVGAEMQIAPEGKCKWVYGEPFHTSWRYCSRDAVGGAGQLAHYCAAHGKRMVSC